ncbi:SAV_2336 N-terminal domain-related protein [Amycolatopsis magusensis]|uniref:SAV_2336 N-terminal domain-related protein n=1 Tax=Amycolatopsis magusensis TaxID=882444 RepID=UPI003FD7B4EB
MTILPDDGPSMALWRLVSAFVEVLERLGAFCTIQVRPLKTVKADSEEILVFRRGRPGAPARELDKLLDPPGRRAVLLTDSVGDAWQHELLYPMLARWARTMPVNTVHLLPQWLWRQCGLNLRRAELRVAGALKSSSQWAFDLTDARLDSDSAELFRVEPMFELQPQWLAWWAKMMAGEHDGAAEGAILLSLRQARQAGSSDTSGTPSPSERVHRFRSVASPPALRLAQLLAAVPVHLDVARVIKQRFVPEAGLEHLLELLVSGIMYAPGLKEGQSTWDTGGVFAFPEAVRELLLSGARRSETASVVRVAATHFGGRIPVLGHLRDAIADPHNTPDPVLTLETTADVELESAVMRALSGPYLSRADRLRNAVLRPGSVVPATEPIQSVSPRCLRRLIAPPTPLPRRRDARTRPRNPVWPSRPPDRSPTPSRPE